MLGGYENTVLGYRTSQYADMKKEGMLDSIDVIMLGNVANSFSYFVIKVSKEQPMFLYTMIYMIILFCKLNIRS